MKNQSLRNIAIIAHVDHGKTSLVNEMLKQSGIFRDNQVVQDRVMDNIDLERERGITILAKNTSLRYKGIKINIVDTPGHADFGGALKMVDGVLLVVDAFEGPMPQTRFVLEKALELQHKVIIVINKMDRPDKRVDEVCDEVLELLLDLNANDEQLESPFVFCSARNGTSSLDSNTEGTNFEPLLDKIIEYMPAPEGDETKPFQMLVSSTEVNDYVGKLAIGKITRGSVNVNQMIVLTNYHKEKEDEKSRISSIFQYEGLKKVNVDSATIGDIVCISGCPSVRIGDTLTDANCIEALPFVKISEPSVEMTFSVNNSPFAGKEGKYVTSRHIRDRLYKEANRDLSLRVRDGNTTEEFIVAGRGEMHLSILIETMRREGYEFQVSMPRVLYKYDGDKKLEPMDKLVIDVPADSTNIVMQKMGIRKGELLDMLPKGSRVRMIFKIPSRGLFGYRSEFLTDTRGEGVMSSVYLAHEEYRGDIERRPCGSLVAYETGTSIVYGMFSAQERGPLFITAGTEVYAGMVVGENPKGTKDMLPGLCFFVVFSLSVLFKIFIGSSFE